MLETLTHHHSPLEQTRRRNRVRLSDANRQLSDHDQATLKRVLADRCDFVPNPLFGKPDAQRRLFDEVEPIKVPDTSWYRPVLEKLGDTRSVKTATAPPLTTAQERAIFLQFNYCRYKVAQLRAKVGDGAVDCELATQILDWFAKVEAYRDQITQSNLALVLAMAKRVWTTVEFPDLVSEGNMALLRAVDKFDAGRGFKFSTYACRAMLKAFSRLGIQATKHRQFFSIEFDPRLERTDFMETKRSGHESDCVDEVRQIFRLNKAALTDIEQQVLKHRFALGLNPNDRPDHGPLTLEEVGKIIGVTKERVRQIQKLALMKLRTTLERGFLGRGKPQNRFA